MPDYGLDLEFGIFPTPDASRHHEVVELARLGRRNGWGLAVMYGQTEATARMSVLPPQLAERHPDSVGWPVAGSRFRVDPGAVDATPEAYQPLVADPQASASGAGESGGADVPLATVGELVFEGPGVMMGYAEHPDDLALPRMITELRTGDIGTVDEDGLVRRWGPGHGHTFSLVGGLA